MADDMTLLREYAETRSEVAFSTLVDRHIHFVYSSALRQVRDPQLAQEVTQVVFIILARKAAKISPNSILSGWLFKTVRFTASAQIKAHIRRQRREQEAQVNSLLTQEPSPEQTWQQMSPLLDEALAKLSETDRQAVLMRYFENKSLAQVGGALAVNEDAARKRVGRAVEKLRQFFARRGVALSVLAIGSALSTHAVQAAPPGLAAAISASAIKGSAGAASTLTLLKGALKLMTLAKLKLAAATGAAAIAVAATALAVEELVVETTAQPAAVATASIDTVRSDTTATAATRPAESTVSSSANAVVEKASSTPAQSAEIDDSAWSTLSSGVFAKLPAAFILRPTHFSGQKSGMISTVSVSNDSQNTKMLARAISFQTLLGAAYAVPPSRVLFPDGVPDEKVDVLMNTPGASLQMLQDAIKKQYGLSATREMREGDVLVVKVKNSEAPGLKPGQQGDSQVTSAIAVEGGLSGSGGAFGTVIENRRVLSTDRQSGSVTGMRTAVRIGRNEYNAQGQTISGLLQQLQNNFEAPLDDETGLTGTYDISLKWEPPSDGSKASDAIKAAMLDQLGLELTPDRAQIEMLVVRKVD